MRTCYYTDIRMACPLFVPEAPLGAVSPESAPLGDLFAGRCSADPAAAISSETLRRCCNRGYARTACERASLAEADAHRFLVKADDGHSVTVAWSSERDHLPLATGYAVVRNESTAATDPLAAQARACATAYRRFSGKTGIRLSAGVV